MKHFMDTKSHNWREAGLARQISARAVRRARLEFVVLFPALAGVLLVYGYRSELFGPDFDIPVRIGTVVALMILGWALARGRRPGARPVPVPPPGSRHGGHASASSCAW